MDSNSIWHIIYNLDVSMLLYISCFNDIYAANSELILLFLLFNMEHGQMQQILNFQRFYQPTIAHIKDASFFNQFTSYQLYYDIIFLKSL